MKAFLYRVCAIFFSHFVLYPDYRISFFIPLAFRFADYTIPYLVPRAEKLLKTIGRNFQDSLSSKGLSSRKIIVTSVLRTTGNVKKLRKKNVNASANSAHVYGTTFDVAYARYKGAEKEETDKLKSVLAEVLQDLRKQKKCYVRYEFKQGCFHITVR